MFSIHTVIRIIWDYDAFVLTNRRIVFEYLISSHVCIGHSMKMIKICVCGIRFWVKFNDLRSGLIRE